MATIKEVVLQHHKKGDGTYNIKYRLTHNRKITYINTNYFAGEKQLKKDFTVKDKFGRLLPAKIYRGSTLETNGAKNVR